MYVPTIFETYAVRLVVDGKLLDLRLVDTTGREQHDGIRPLSYYNTHIFLVSSGLSLENVSAKVSILL